jgi:hypothetical protein
MPTIVRERASLAPSQATTGPVFEVTDLSFVRTLPTISPHGRLRDFWDFPVTGRYEIDWAIGEAMLRQYARYRRQPDVCGFLQWIVKDMAAKGRIDGAEYAFLDGLDALAFSHPLVARRA